MKTFHLSVAEGIRQNAYNQTFSTHAEISTLDDLKKAVQFDHVAGLFKNDARSVPNFIEADCIIMDCDNDHSDNPPETPKKKAVLIFYMPYHVSIQLCWQYWRGIVANSCICYVKIGYQK